MTTRDREQQAEEQFVSYWIERQGPKLQGESLWRALGFGSLRSFQRAVQSDQLGVRVYREPEGGGRCARTEDVARLLWRRLEQRRRAAK